MSNENTLAQFPVTLNWNDSILSTSKHQWSFSIQP